jgi:hypothetical protein
MNGAPSKGANCSWNSLILAIGREFGGFFNQMWKNYVAVRYFHEYKCQSVFTNIRGNFLTSDTNLEAIDGVKQ